MTPSETKKSLSKTLAFSLTALILCVPANALPFVTMELYGSRTSPTLWETVKTLVEDGSWLIAVIIFFASIVIPIFKLVALFYISMRSKSTGETHLKLRIYRAIEVIGRWSMLDIFILAILVAILKLGPWTSAQPEVGSYMFALVVIFTMLASASFDPRLLSESEKV